MDRETVETIIDSILATGRPAKVTDPFQVAVIPKDCKVEALEPLIEKFREAPRKKSARVMLRDVGSFIDYFNRFCSEASVIFADDQALCATGILDYHHAGEGPAAWRDHQVRFDLSKTVEWQTWRDNDGLGKTQIDFARFIEDNTPDILEPPAAEMLEVARNLQATRSVQFASSVSLADGTRQFTYIEEEQAGVGKNKGSMKVPESFKLRMQCFVGGPVQDITARLRHRIKDGKLTFWYSLLRPHKIDEAAFNDVVAKIGKGTKDAPILIGAA